MSAGKSLSGGGSKGSDQEDAVQVGDSYGKGLFQKFTQVKKILKGDDEISMNTITLQAAPSMTRDLAFIEIKVATAESLLDHMTRNMSFPQKIKSIADSCKEECDIIKQFILYKTGHLTPLLILICRELSEGSPSYFAGTMKAIRSTLFMKQGKGDLYDLYLDMAKAATGSPGFYYTKKRHKDNLSDHFRRTGRGQARIDRCLGRRNQESHCT